MKIFRPNASNGIWLSALLFVAYLSTILRNPKTVLFSYELFTILLFGMFLQSLETVFILSRENPRFETKIYTIIMPSFVTSFLLAIVLDQLVSFSIITSLAVLFTYRFIYLLVMKSLPFSFSLGEASIVAQGLVIFLYSCYLKIPMLSHVKSNHESMNVVLQVGLLGVLVLTSVTYMIPIFRKSILFYVSLISVITGVCFFPIGQKPAVTILYNFVFNDLERIMIVGVYVALLVIAGIFVNWQIRKNKRGTTSARKTFHILIVMVFMPGLIFQCQFLYVASVVILAIFIVLELARVIKLVPVADILESSVKAFIDEKDAGKVALTPIYLLVGCSLPLWIHNSPCDVAGSSSFELVPLISGLLSIGIGDTFASVIGSLFGKHKWPKSNKSVEGTIASILAQTAFIYSLYLLGFVPLNVRLAAICGVAVIINSLIEALTDQVDNLVLPIVTYIILVIK